MSSVLSAFDDMIGSAAAIVVRNAAAMSASPAFGVTVEHAKLLPLSEGARSWLED